MQLLFARWCLCQGSLFDKLTQNSSHACCEYHGSMYTLNFPCSCWLPLHNIALWYINFWTKFIIGCPAPYRRIDSEHFHQENRGLSLIFSCTNQIVHWSKLGLDVITDNYNYWLPYINKARFSIALCPAHMCLPARNSLVNKVKFLGLIPKKL